MEKITKTKSTKKTSMQISVVNEKGVNISTMDLPSGIFDITASDKLLALYVRVYLNNQRKGLALTKTRSMVRGSTRKIYRQKGTGRARHGANTAPIFVGGGVAHGPIGSMRRLKMNKKQRTLALFTSITKAFKTGKMSQILDAGVIDGTTKQFNQVIKNLSKDSKATIVYSGSKEPMIKQAATNLDAVTLSQSETLNAYTVMASNKIIFTKTGIEQFINQHESK